MNMLKRFDFVVSNGVTVTILESSLDLALERFIAIFGEHLLTNVTSILII